jgi:Nucleotidyl transferase of unknown function (DUF2204)
MTSKVVVTEQDHPLPVTSSVEPEFEEVQAALYRGVLLELNRVEVPYAVSGAFALQQHTGIWRVTKDLDLFLTAENVPRALSTLREQGFDCEICDPVWLAKAHHGEFFVDLITGMSNAALIVTDEWIQRSSPAVVIGVNTRVLGPEELIASKLFVTRRERFDGADIAHVIYGTKGKLDWNWLLQLVGEHWEILLWSLLLFRYVYPAQTDYVPAAVWKDLLSRLASELKSFGRDDRFRGSLIDDKMFAIDVKEWGLPDILEEYRARRVPKLSDCVPEKSDTSEPAA